MDRRGLQVRAFRTANWPADWPALWEALVHGIVDSATPERADRLYSGDPRRHRRAGGVTLAYGAAGVLHALHAVHATIPPEHVDWLARRAVEAAEQPFGGLYEGPLGAALTLDRLGATDAATEVVKRVRDHRPGVLTVRAGQAGVALALLARGEECDLDTVEDLVGNVAAALRGDRFDGVLPGEAGLFDGLAGLGLLMVRAYEHTADPRYLDLAGLAMRRGAGGRSSVGDMPGGIVLAITELLRHRPDHELRGFAERVLDGLPATRFIDAGLLTGQAGMIAVLRHCRPSRLLLGEVAGLARHAVDVDGRLRITGRPGQRPSADLATGTAGVLLALRPVLGGGRLALPGIL
jgi:hypothetical protein